MPSILDDIGSKLSINKFSSALIRRQVLREGGEKVALFANKLGPERLAYLLDNNKDLSFYLPKELEAQWRAAAPKYAFLAQIISDEDVWTMLPPWARTLVESRGPAGVEWWKKQLAWIRSFMGS
mgnify:CR=1 FL=1